MSCFNQAHTASYALVMLWFLFFIKVSLFQAVKLLHIKQTEQVLKSNQVLSDFQSSGSEPAPRGRIL